ncbi:hypothetical protein BBL07_21675 [Agrobacterium vitis]|nr:hypothetical protein BBL07_21675 [Agrobacterium vitis]
MAPLLSILPVGGAGCNFLIFLDRLPQMPISHVWYQIGSRSAIEKTPSKFIVKLQWFPFPANAQASSNAQGLQLPM